MTRLFFSLDAVLATAVQVQALRHGSTEASDASDFLPFLSWATGAKNALLTAMLVDAFDISLCLLRLFDKDSFDAAELHQQLNNFVRKLGAAFCKKGILTTEPCCSSGRSHGRCSADAGL